MDGEALGIEPLREFLASDQWKTTFSEGVLAAGYKTARAQKVTSAQAEILETGDLEITGLVLDHDGHQHEVALVFWSESGSIMLDPECSCAVRSCCEHGAALLEHLKRPQRLENAFGHSSGATPEPQKQLSSDSTPPTSTDSGGSTSARFHLHIHKPSNLSDKSDDPPRFPWLPEVFATAEVSYEGAKFPLDPSGNIAPPRSRAAEMNALNMLYALDLIPGAEQPPPSLKKLDVPEYPSTLWAPDKQQWQPSLYWQKFQHEAVTSLEKHGWEITIAPGVGHKPLVFQSETMRTEIVEEGRGWFHLSAGFEIEGETFDLQPILATLVEYQFLDLTKDMPDGQQFLIFLPDGRGMSLPVGRFRKILTHLGELIDYQFTGGPIRMHKIEAAEVLDSIDEEIGSVESPDEIAAVRQQSSLTYRELAKVPTALEATLRSYQLEGFQWMQFLTNNQLNGILADDMGLGKTLQTITHILAEKEKGNTLPNLVIAPTSVVVNWQREVAKFAPSLQVLILQGSGRHRLFDEVSTSDIVLSSYALLHRDLEKFLNHEFHLLVLDEAQHIKNPSAQVSQAVRQLNSHHRLCLSGTPIENHLGELWSQFDFLMPGLLGTADSFRETFRTPIEKNHNQQRADALATKVGSLILRRTKHEVATELPPKTEIPHLIELGEAEKDLYETVRATMDKHVRQAFAAKTGKQAQIVFLDALLKLRQICCHPKLVSNNSSHPADSAKLTYLTDLLITLRREGHRVLLFSQFTSMLEIIESWLQAEEFTYLKLTGASQNRQELVERFQNDEAEIFLISLKAGGTGLTLTNADTVIHYDPWWNPAAENQATDRAYRIGQDKPVMVHKLICRGTVEQRIQQMQEKKSAVSDSILTASLNQLKLDDDVLDSLFSPLTPQGSGE